MLSFNVSKLSRVAALTIPSTAISLQNSLDCGWLGCTGLHQQTSLSSEPYSHSGAGAYALSPGEIVKSVQSLTAKTKELNQPASSITIANGPRLVVGQGPYSFSSLVATLRSLTMPFSRVSAVNFRVLTGKASLFAEIPVIEAPVAAILRQYEHIIDTLAFTLLDLVPSKSSDISVDTETVLKAIEAAITEYA
ncbi:hypothetical protein BST61_g4212 [Cercospora zeina]